MVSIPDNPQSQIDTFAIKLSGGPVNDFPVRFVIAYFILSIGQENEGIRRVPGPGQQPFDFCRGNPQAGSQLGSLPENVFIGTDTIQRNQAAH